MKKELILLNFIGYKKVNKLPTSVAVDVEKMPIKLSKALFLGITGNNICPPHGARFLHGRAYSQYATVFTVLISNIGHVHYVCYVYCVYVYTMYIVYSILDKQW